MWVKVQKYNEQTPLKVLQVSDGRSVAIFYESITNTTQLKEVRNK